MMQSIKTKGRDRYIQGMKHLVRIYAYPTGAKYDLAADRELEAKRILCLDKCNSAMQSQVIVFDIEQIKVFWGLIKNERFLPSSDYKLPFADTWIQFSENFALYDYGNETMPDLGNVALLLTQQESGSNRIIVVHEENDDEEIAWNSNDPNILFSFPFENLLESEKYRMLAAACIDYINCENVYLHREGVVDESVNAKRERKGKSRMEPYYVCRIRGVQYDSNGNEHPTGVKQSIRYDVRGHFRRLENGKTTWVRPHQRGLQNELYVPKTYLVDKKFQA